MKMQVVIKLGNLVVIEAAAAAVVVVLIKVKDVPVSNYLSTRRMGEWMYRSAFS
jgi:hypothetical protein